MNVIAYTAKTCPKCGETHPATPEYFCTQTRSADGLHSWCKPCNIKRNKEWQANNRDKVLANKKLYRERHPERVSEQQKRAVAKKPEQYQMQQRAWREANAEHVKQQHAARYQRNIIARRKQSADWYWEHRDYARARSKEFRILNQDYIREEKRKYAQENREHINAYKKAWAASHPESVKQTKRKVYEENKDRWKRYGHDYRARKYQAEGHWTTEQIAMLYEELSGRCAFCGISIYPEIRGDVHIEHLNPITRGGTNWIDNLTLSCAHCNKSKWTRTPEEWMAVRGW